MPSILPRTYRSLSYIRPLRRMWAARSNRSFDSPTTSKSFTSTSGTFDPSNTHDLSENHDHIQSSLPLKNILRNARRFHDFDMEGRVYAITGGGRGLGLSMGEALTEAGAKVYALDRLESPHPDFLKAKEKAEKEYDSAMEYIRIDVRDNTQVQNTFAAIAAQEKRLDGLVAAAGINHLQSALDHSQQALNDVLSINYTGVFNSATAAARQMFNYQKKGSILLVASMSGLIANKGMTSPVYNSSKAAVIQLARSLAMEWGRYGVRVNSLCPGHILTPMVEDVFRKNPGARAIWEAENMLGRLAMPEEFRGAAMFCLSDASSFMTGSTLVIDGGHTAW
ncbi:hypothetical protein POX_d05112 [Penicillium oxalicum]|uniref:Uncharacterized protein n=1 Tax=Penicillium oxalicum (strain 114-2 / CGMCC 5302) TaxID=933388 RepID=S8BCR0_PENO1|nr:hypothetical protein POX_d05112 [Penicillium oxalicum]EPS32732.1 hypothetical protein PDE_07692 [Penicillium oxalicum 114-2]KAI2789618.1 hypothetical protein POX_d05112 [Penicillium oxalicum]